jgi:hypothetical protein
LHAGPTHSLPKKITRALAHEEKTQRLTMTTVDPESAAQYRLTINQNHEFHEHWLFYSTNEKLEQVEEVYRSHEQAIDSS